MNSLVRLLVLVLLSGPAVLPAQAGFSSIYIFGDGVSTTTTTSNQPTAYFYGNRYCNGRVWVEVLAQRQGLPNNTITNVNWSYSPNNHSYFGHYSVNLLTTVNQFSATNAATALFVVWVNDADFVWDMSYIYPSLDPATWNNAIKNSLANHQQALTNLYAKGARTLIMPNAVDITKIPFYAGLTTNEQSFIRQRVLDFNTGFTAMVNQVKASLPGVKIYIPDFFALLENMQTNAASYGFINTASDALDDGYSAWNGPGANYLFWDYLDPTAKAHELMADTAQQLISPAVITNLTLLSGSNRLDTASLPIGLSGVVQGRSNLVSGTWTSLTNFNSSNATQTIFLPASGSARCYRLQFPFAWTWP